MLVFLFACFFFQTLRGAPLTPDASPLLSARESPPEPDQQYRTAFDIIKSCLLTIFACVWQSAHPNLNGPRDSGWTCMKRKIMMMLCALIAPELVLYWALRQHTAAKSITEQYNGKFAILSVYKVLQATSCTRFLTFKADLDQMNNKSPWGTIVDWFRPLPKETTRRGAGQPWTKTHGFFIQMGGFMLYSNSYPVEVLTYKRLASLLEQKAIDTPTVTERELQDRSKGDWLSKGIIVFQTTWFIMQCVTRAIRRLPLSELEVLTLAFALMNGAIYAAWWNKPQGAYTTICVPLKTVDWEKSTVEDTVLPSAAVGPEASADQPPMPVDDDGNTLPCPDSRRHTRMSDSVSLEPPHEHAHENEQIEHAPSVAVGPEASADQPPMPVDDDGNTLPRPYALGHSLVSDSVPLEPPHEHAYEDERIEHASWKWLRSRVRRKRNEPYSVSSSLAYLFLLPLLLVGSILRVFNKIGQPKCFDERYLRVPMFHDDKQSGDSDTGEYAFAIMAVLFGAVHLLAWSSEFASMCDRILWQVSAISVTVPLFFATLAAVLGTVAFKKRSLTYGIRGIIIYLLDILLYICALISFLLFFLSMLLYVPARVVLIFVAFNSFRNTPTGVLVDVPWTSSLPHF